MRAGINPETFSEGMFSWFPLYFPLRVRVAQLLSSACELHCVHDETWVCIVRTQTPAYVARGQIIEVEIWRRLDSHKAWYEWALTSPSISPVHNPLGRSYYIGL